MKDSGRIQTEVDELMIGPGSQQPPQRIAPAERIPGEDGSEFAVSGLSYLEASHRTGNEYSVVSSAGSRARAVPPAPGARAGASGAPLVDRRAGDPRTVMGVEQRRAGHRDRTVGVTTR